MKIKCVIGGLLLALVVACTKSVPEAKLSYVGDWRSPEMSMLIYADGTVSYKREKNGGSTSVDGPLKRFEGDDFVVGIGPISTTFEVSQPPALRDGKWQMVVDGVELTKFVE